MMESTRVDAGVQSPRRPGRNQGTPVPPGRPCAPSCGERIASAAAAAAVAITRGHPDELIQQPVDDGDGDGDGDEIVDAEAGHDREREVHDQEGDVDADVAAELPGDDDATPDPEFVPFDALRLKQFRLLASMRKRGSAELSSKDGIWRVYWPAGDFQYAVVATDGSGRSVGELCSEVRFGPLLSRTLIAIQARLVATGNLTVRLDARRMADRLWGRNAARPRNWRQLLRRSLRSASVLWVAFEGRVQKLIESCDDRDHEIVVKVHMEFVGALQCMVGEDGVFTLVRKRSPNGAKVTPKDVEDFRSRCDFDTAQLDDEAVTRAVRAHRKQESAKPSLQSVGRDNRLCLAFLPAHLGEPSVCRELGDLAALLHRETTRRPRLVEQALVPGWSGGARVTCPLLDKAVNYSAFAANGGTSRKKVFKAATARAGRGYRLRTWADRLGTGVSELIDSIRSAAPKLGLIAAGIDARGTWYSLDEIAAASDAVRDALHLRIYTAEGHVGRWCEVFGWRRRFSGGSVQVKPEGEPMELHALVRVRGGVRAVARESGIDASKLSKVLTGKVKARAAYMEELRRHLMGGRAAGGAGTGSIFRDCKTMLDYALAYRRQGWGVVPMESPTTGRKKPRVRTTPYFASLPTEAEIRSWWGMWPDAGIAVILGPVSGLLVIDVDGEEAYDALIHQLGAEPAAPKAMSGSGDPYRMHFFFRHPRVPTKASVKPWHEKLEFRGTKGILVLAPSPHASGSQYSWIEGRSLEDLALPEVPKKILAALQMPTRARPATPIAAESNPVTTPPAGGVDAVDGLRVSQRTASYLRGMYKEAIGQRNDRLFEAACEFKARGVPYEAAVPRLLAGLTVDDAGHRHECVATIRSAYAKERNAQGLSA